TTAALLIGAGLWVWHDHPLEWRRTDSPALHELPADRLAADLDRDERALAGVIDGIAGLEQRFLVFETQLLAGERSYYDPADDDEIRRMLATFLALRDATLRTAWTYERHGQLPLGPDRRRAARLHATALILSYDLAARTRQLRARARAGPPPGRRRPRRLADPQARLPRRHPARRRRPRLLPRQLARLDPRRRRPPARPAPGPRPHLAAATPRTARQTPPRRHPHRAPQLVSVERLSPRLL